MKRKKRKYFLVIILDDKSDKSDLFYNRLLYNNFYDKLYE